MARSLSTGLEGATLAVKRKPAFKVLIYDVRAGFNSIGDVVREILLAPETGPRDFTADLLNVDIEEVAGDFVENGVSTSAVQLTVLDPHALLDPLDGSEGRWLRERNVVRLIEGDARVPEDEWKITFTGEILGQAGQSRSRAVGPNGESLLSARAVGREARYLGYQITSRNFGRGTGFLFMANTLAEEEMQLDTNEIALSAFGGQVTGQPTQFVETEPLKAIAQIMFPDGFMPRFLGNGKLGQTDSNVTKAPVRIYPDFGNFIRITRPFSNVSPANRVCVIGLAADMSEVRQPEQTLATVRITTGYFTRDEEIEVFWSEDKTVLAKNSRMRILKGINSGISVLGGDESYSPIPSPQGEGSIGGVITVDTGFAPWIIVFLTVIYAILAFIPDLTAFGETIPIGRVVQAIALGAILYLMTKIGRGEYEIVGEPFEYVFLEVKRCARVKGVALRDYKQETITNHLVQTNAIARQAALRTLRRLRARANPRQVEMFHDLTLEPDDVFETPDGRSYLVRKIQRSLARNADSVRALLECFETTPGVQP